MAKGRGDPVPSRERQKAVYYLRALDLDPGAARARFLSGVHDADVPTLAPVGRVPFVAVGHVDPVEATASRYHVLIFRVLVGEHEVVAASRDDLVVLAVAYALQDLVVPLAPG